MNSWNELVTLVDDWAESKGIYNASNPQAQLLKAVSEMGELCDAEVKNLAEDAKDGVGDVLVCLIFLWLILIHLHLFRSILQFHQVYYDSNTPDEPYLH